jgi:hypothetical protein
MNAFKLAAISLATLAVARPHAHTHSHAQHVEARDDDTFAIKIHNRCSTDKTFGVYQVSPSFEMIETTTPVKIASGNTSTIYPPFQGIGLRLSATADKGCDAQWSPQTLFEFGYSEYAGLTGTAYDLSIMQATDEFEGVAAYPGTDKCPSKLCAASGCALDQAWTNPDQVDDGSPADMVCYQGKQNFKVVWCPTEDETEDDD